MSSTEVRVATRDDLSDVAALFDRYRQFYEQEPNIALATQFIRDRMANKESVILVAQDETKNMVGFCQLYPTFCSVIAAPIYVLYDLFVDPVTRRQGAGKALLLAAREHAVKNGITRMDLTTAKTNFPAQALYQSLGWVRDEIFYTYNLQVGG